MALKFKASLDDSDFQAGIRRMGETADTAGRKISSVLSGGIGKAAGYIGAGLGLSAINAEIDRLSAIKDEAASIDLPIEEFQRLSFVFQQSGSDAETFRKGMANLTESFVAARDGASKQAEAMNALGLSLKTTNEADATGALSDIADAYVKSTDKGAAFAAIADLVGAKVAVKMIPALVDGGAALRELADSATIASEEMVRFGEDLGDKFSAAVVGAKNRIVGGWYAIGKAAQEGFKEGAGYSKDIGLPEWVQKLTGIGGALVRGTMGGNEGAVDEGQLKSLEAQKEETELKKKAVELDLKARADKKAQDSADKGQYDEFKKYSDQIEATRQQYSDWMSYKSAQEEKANALTEQLIDSEEKLRQKAMIEDAQALAASVNAQVAAIDEVRGKMTSAIRNDPHHFAANQKRENLAEARAEAKADRAMGITPKDRRNINDVQKLVNAAPKTMQAKIDEGQLNKLIQEIGKLIMQ